MTAKWKEAVVRSAGTEAAQVVVGWHNDVPRCDEDRCPFFDGKRCERLGHRPDSICEPVVWEMSALLTRAVK